MKKSMMCLLALLCALALAACGKEEPAQTQSQVQQYMEKRQVFCASNLCIEAQRYLEDALTELVPDGTCEISVEPGDYIDAAEDELAGHIADAEAAQAFFARAQVSWKVNYWDYDMDPEALCQALLERGISGTMVTETSDHFWELNAVEGTAQLQQRPAA